MKRSGKHIYAADLFCGAGGTSQGLVMAANEMDADLTLTAVNHWQVAIDTHSANHPYAQHLCTGLDNVDPRKLVPSGRLNVLCASPECTHFSSARGGKPCSDQSRASAWHILRFAEALYIDNLVIENVREFQSWGPLDVTGRPMKSKRGQLFEQFIASLRALGYRVEWRVLNCADYGDPTTRERLFIIAGDVPAGHPLPDAATA
jgi:DNA (cytosine-5)-methyltransferase 1